jgi:uncharacterized 2Fe-2S/4Fe-4S cluster protein (DUF4445 family)
MVLKGGYALYHIRNRTGTTIITSPGTLLMDALVEAGVMRHDFPCNRNGICKKCKVAIKSGEEWTEVLSCQTVIESDLEIDVSPVDGAAAVCLHEGHGRRAVLSPVVRKTLVSPSPDGKVPGWEELCLRARIPNEHVRATDASVLRTVASLGQQKTAFTLAIRGHEIIAAEIGDTQSRIYGMAFDIGTTTVVGYLIDLCGGHLLATASALNPQVQYGADVISRITYADQEKDGLERLRSSIVACVNSLIGEAAGRANIDRRHIYDLVFVGNTCMHHLFLGILPTALGRYPYQPVVRSAVTLNALRTGIEVNEQADLTWLPALAGFVGADTIGMLLAHPLQDELATTLAVDIGTNGEIVLASGGGLWACSAAAGPAFEGYSMASGIRAQTGAVDEVRIESDSVFYHVIGEVKPKGICGSGFADAVAGLLKSKLIDRSGLLVSGNPGPVSKRIVDRNGSMAFLLVPGEETSDGREILVTQRDIRYLQLAKAAISTGILLLLREAGVRPDDIEKVILAGAFGLYLKPESIQGIRLLPEPLCGKIVAVGNAAGVGAQNALLSHAERSTAQELARKIRYVELAGRKDFEELFMDELSF